MVNRLHVPINHCHLNIYNSLSAVIKVLLLSKYPRMGASSRLRSFQYLPYLKDNNFEIKVNSFFDDVYLNKIYSGLRVSKISIAGYYLKRMSALLDIFKYDLIWIEKEIFPYFPALIERLLKLLGKRYVVDYDDAIFHNYDSSSNFFVRLFLHRKIDSVMRNATCVIAGNKYLAERAKLACTSRVEQIPTVLNHHSYIPRSPTINQRLVIGWIGSPSTQKYVIGIRSALNKVCIENGARLLLVGASPQIVLEFPDIDVEVIPWSEESETHLIRQMDIGIMPLSDGPWEKGKCGYKLIQYMACAVPVVASPIGVNVDIVNTNHCGFLASNTTEWSNSLEQLLNSTEERISLGLSGRQAVELSYSLHVQSPVLSRILSDSAKE